MGPRLGGPLPAGPDPPREYGVVNLSPSFGDAQPRSVLEAVRRNLLSVEVTLHGAVRPPLDTLPGHMDHADTEPYRGPNPRSRFLRAPASACCMRGRELTDEQRRLLDAHLEGLGGEGPRKSVCCSITLEAMKDPVVAADGYTYERAAIERWVAAKPCSPMTNEPMGAHLVPNIAVRNLIDDALATVEQKVKAPGALPGENKW